jgi:hypothetical protein
MNFKPGDFVRLTEIGDKYDNLEGVIVSAGRYYTVKFPGFIRQGGFSDKDLVRISALELLAREAE